MQLDQACARPWWRTYFHPGPVPYWSIHLGAIAGVALLGWSWAGLALALVLYGVRMAVVTVGYHRYFSHRSFRTSRVFQFLLALAAVSCGQKGVLWWAAHHRNHHRHSDDELDVHSPRRGFWWSHVGWILSHDLPPPDLGTVKDLSRYPELRWLERLWALPPLAYALVLFALGGRFAVVWGFFVCQVLLWHGSFTINSLGHVIGTRRFATGDDSRNHWLLALITSGEGWHNNHHQRPGSARQGMLWWEIDVSYYVLRGLALCGLVWGLNERPPRQRDEAPPLAAAEPPASAV
jgi:stearoyl-CoA desaturase (delta-9 desaturase)